MDKLKKYRLPKKMQFIFLLFVGVLILYYFISFYIIEGDIIYQQSDIQKSYLMFSLLNTITVICFLYCMAGIGQYYLKVQHVHLLKQQNQFAKEELQKIQLEENEYYNQIIKQQKKIIQLIENNQDLNHQMKSLENAVYKQNIRFCHNGIIDTVIASKVKIMDEKAIQFIHSIVIPDKLQIAAIDLSTIIFNLLDNAIAACDCLPDHKMIELKMNYQYHVLKIHVRNSSSAHHQKKSEKGHGYGLKIVNDIAKKYNGDIEILDKGNEYMTYIYLYEETKND